MFRRSDKEAAVCARCALVTSLFRRHSTRRQYFFYLSLLRDLVVCLAECGALCDGSDLCGCHSRPFAKQIYVLNCALIESPAPETWKTSSRRYCAGLVQKSRRQRTISR